jgi:ribonuclease H2 subunit A
MNFPSSSFSHFRLVQGKCRLGVDEAGRGPVMGPMVYAVAFCPLDRDLSEFGFADSKVLKPQERRDLFDQIRDTEWLGWGVSSISAQEISYKMLQRQRISLNEIAHNTTIDMIRHVLDQGVELHEIYVDTVGPCDKYQAKLCALFPGISITVAKKADSKYPIVSAASICAKVTRDHILDNFEFTENTTVSTKFGSGYPAGLLSN